jgi:hypothetical protein
MTIDTASKRNEKYIRRLLGPLFRFWQKHQWLLISALWIIALYLGFVGLSKYTDSLGQDLSVQDLFYLLLQLITLESGAVTSPPPWELEVARFSLPALAAFTAVQALALLFKERAQLISLRFIRDHIVVCGLSQKGFLLARGFLEAGDKVVVIELDEDNDLIEQCKARGAIVIMGDAADRTLLQQAVIQRSRGLLAVCDDDGTNAEIAVQAQQVLASKKRAPLTCIVHIVDPLLCDLLREKEISRDGFPALRLELFNIYQRGAQLMWESFPIESATQSSPDSDPHLLVVGLGNLGENVVIHAARSWYMQHPLGDHQLRITVIDHQAQARCEALTVRYPKLASSCALRPLSMDVSSPEFYHADFLQEVGGGSTVNAVYICLDHESLALSAALTLLQHLKDSAALIAVRMPEETGLGSLLSGQQESTGSFGSIHAFGLLERTCTPDLLWGGTHEILAQALYKEYARLGAHVDVRTWDQLSRQEKESNRLQVDRIGEILSAVEYAISPLTDWGNPIEFSSSEIETMARCEHEHWCEDLRRKGWSYAPQKKNPKKKTHPALLAWEDLPEVDKEKNRNPVREIPELLASVGFTIDRTG